MNPFNLATSFLKLESNSPISTIACLMAVVRLSLFEGSRWCPVSTYWSLKNSSVIKLLTQLVLPRPCGPWSVRIPLPWKPLGSITAATMLISHLWVETTLTGSGKPSRAINVSLIAWTLSVPSHDLLVIQLAIGLIGLRSAMTAT